MLKVETALRECSIAVSFEKLLSFLWVENGVLAAPTDAAADVEEALRARREHLPVVRLWAHVLACGRGNPVSILILLQPLLTPEEAHWVTNRAHFPFSLG